MTVTPEPRIAESEIPQAAAAVDRWLRARAQEAVMAEMEIRLKEIEQRYP
ncbi:MAG: hypothetical protein LBJ59_11240 [Zoogloeaceae bacterium]|nr:hypothetical protein [Zoogloeaceae bacterium]